MSHWGTSTSAAPSASSANRGSYAGRGACHSSSTSVGGTEAKKIGRMLRARARAAPTSKAAPMLRRWACHSAVPSANKAGKSDSEKLK